jgi:hypothetical protein
VGIEILNISLKYLPSVLVLRVARKTNLVSALPYLKFRVFGLTARKVKGTDGEGNKGRNPKRFVHFQ